MREKILIVAKTYPNLSKKYVETVCVAGITDNNGWVRLFPVKFRDLPNSKKFKKFDIIEADISKTNDKYLRRESRKINENSISITGSLPVSKVSKKIAKKNWEIRKKFLLSRLDKSIEELESKKKAMNKSIGIIKPKKIVSFFKKNISECRDWERDLIEGTQKTLLGNYESPLDKIPYWMGYKFYCNNKSCKGHNMMCEDWEMLQLFRTMKKKYGTDEKAFEKVKEKYFDWMQKRDLYFIVGTEIRFNKFLIIATFYPPK